MHQLKLQPIFTYKSAYENITPGMFGDTCTIRLQE